MWFLASLYITVGKKIVLMDTGDREAFVFTTSLFLLETYSSMWCFSDVSITSSWDSYCSQLLVYIQDWSFGSPLLGPITLNTLNLRTDVLSSFSLVACLKRTTPGIWRIGQRPHWQLELKYLIQNTFLHSLCRKKHTN